LGTGQGPATFPDPVVLDNPLLAWPPSGRLSAAARRALADPRRERKRWMPAPARRQTRLGAV